MRRLRSDELALDEVRAREEWCLKVLAWPPRTAQRAEQLAAMSRALGLSVKQCYAVVAAYERARGTAGGGRMALQRKRRSDAGAPRAGGQELMRDAERLETLFDAPDLAAETRAKAAEAARELRDAFVGFAVRPSNCHLNTTELRRRYLEQHPGVELPHDTTLRRWLAEADPSLMKTRHEAARDKSYRHRLNARYPNHVWQGDQRVADVFVWWPDPDTGELKARRPTLFHFVDRYTGLEMGGEYSWTYSSETVEQALFDAIYPDYEHDLPWCGVPEIIYWDNGEQHRSRWLGHTAQVLGIRLSFSEPHEPTTHGFIEGAHRIIKDSFEAHLPGYCGGDNQEGERPLPWRLAEQREGEMPELLTLAQLNDAWRAWRRRVADEPYRANLLSRNVRYQMCSEERRAVPRLEDIPLAFMVHETRKVSDDGTITVGSRAFSGPWLNELKREVVKIAYLPSHTGHVWVLRRDGTVLAVCEALPDLYMADPASFAVVARDRRRMRQSMAGVDTTKRALEEAAARGELTPEEVQATADTLARLQAVARTDGSTVESLAAARRERELREEAERADVAVLDTTKRRPTERRLAEPEADIAVLREVLAGAVTDQETERPRAARGGLFDI